MSQYDPHRDAYESWLEALRVLAEQKRREREGK